MVCKVITLIIILPNKMKIIKQNSWRRISQSEIRNLAAAESEDGQKFLPPNPLPFCPSERSVWRAKRAISSVQKRFGFRQINAQIKLFTFWHISVCCQKTIFEKGGGHEREDQRLCDLLRRNSCQL